MWSKLFLEQRPSICLAFFRIAVAITVGAVVFPGLMYLADNYYHTAFKTFNTNFFTPEVIEWVQRSSDGVVLTAAIIFAFAWFLFFIGLFTQISGIVMMLACYYFYALNSFHLGTLSWDILLVTLFLMCVTPYPGDYFSVDALRRGEADAYKTTRPFFIQRLIQIQLAATFFFTGLHKITGHGNWLKGNPLFYLMNYPPEGVVKHFLFKDILAQHPVACYWIGVVIVLVELFIPFLLFWPVTRRSAIITGIFFHVLLMLTFDVPATFCFLFIPMFLLFINPHDVMAAIERLRRKHALPGVQDIVVFDGQCRFCRWNVKLLQIMDLFGVLRYVDFHTANLSNLHPELSADKAAAEVWLIEGSLLSGGFFAFRRLCLKLPMLYIALPLVYFPGASLIGPLVYKFISSHRYLFGVHRGCDQACHFPHAISRRN